MREFEEITLVKQPQLQAAFVHQAADLRALERRDPVHAAERLELIDAFLGDHPPIAHHYYLLDAEVGSKAANLRHERFTIARVTVEHRHGDRAAARVGDQPVVHLELALPAVAVVPELCQRTAGAFEVARGKVVEHQAPGLQVARGQLLLDATLMLKKPIHRPIPLVLLACGHREFLRQRRGMPPPRSGELGMRREHARGHHRTHPIAFHAAARGDQLRQPEPLHGHSHGLHVPVRVRGNRFEELAGRGECLAPQNGTDGEDLRIGERREIRQRPLAHARAFTERFAQQVGGARVAVRHDIDVHGCIMRQFTPTVKPNYMATLCNQQPNPNLLFRRHS